MQLKPNFRINRRLGLLLMGLVVLLLTAYYTLSGLLVREYLTPFLHNQVVSQLSEVFERPVEVEALVPSFLNGVKLKGITVKGKAGEPAEILGTEAITVKFNLWQALRTRDFVGSITRIAFEKPYLKLSFDASGKSKLADLFSETGTPTKPFPFRGVVSIYDGEVQILRPNVAPIQISSIAACGGLATYPEVEVALLAKVDGFPVQLAGRYNFEFPGRTDLNFTTSRLSAPKLQRYLAPYLPKAWQDVSRINQGGIRVTINLKGKEYAPGATGPRSLWDTWTYTAQIGLSGVSGRLRLLPLPLARLDGELILTPSQIELKGLALNFGRGQQTFLHGAVSLLGVPELDLVWEGKNLPLAELIQSAAVWPQAKKSLANLRAGGTVDFRATIKGNPRFPQIKGNLGLHSGWLAHATLPEPVQDLNLQLTASGTELKLKHLSGSYQGVSFLVREGIITEPFGNLAAQGQVILKGFNYQGLTLTETRTTVVYQAGRFIVEDLKGKFSQGGTLAGQGRLVLGAEPHYVGELQVTDLLLEPTLSALTGQALPITGKAQGNLYFAGTGWARRGIVANGSLEVREASFQGMALTEGSLGFGLYQDVVSLDYLTAGLGPGEHLRATGEINLAGEDMHLAFNLEGFAIARLASFFPELASTRLAGQAELQGLVTGKLADPRVAAEVEVRQASWQAQTIGRLVGRIDWDGRSLRSEELHLMRANGAEHIIKGQVTWVKGLPQLDLWWRIRSEEVADLVPFTGIELAAEAPIDGTLHLQGPLAQIAAAGEIKLGAGQIGGQRFDSLQVRLGMLEGNFNIEYAHIVRNGSQLDLQGSITHSGRLNLVASAQAVRLEDLTMFTAAQIHPLKGAINFSGLIGGTIHKPIISGKVTGQDLLLAQYQFATLSGQIRLDGTKLELTPLTLEQDISSYVITGELDFSNPVNMNLRAKLERGRLAELFSLAGIDLQGKTDGEVTGYLQLWGEPKNPQGRAMLAVDHWNWGGIPYTGDLDLALVNGMVTINRLRLAQGQGLLLATGSVNRAGALNLETRGTKFNLTALRPFWPNLPQGLVDFSAQLGGTLQAPELTAVVNVEQIKHQDLKFDKIAGELTLRQAVFQIKGFTIERGKDKLELEGKIPLTPSLLARFGLDAVIQPAPAGASLDLKVKMAQGQLAVATLFIPELKEVAGQGMIDLQITGSLAKPLFSGEIALAGGKFTHPALPVKVEKLDGVITFVPGTATLNLTSRSGEGSMALAGVVGLDGLVPANFDLEFYGQNVPYNDGYLCETVASGKLRLTGPAQTPLLAGYLDLSRARINWGRLGGSKERAWDPRLDVRLRTLDTAVFRNSEMLETWFQGELTFSGSWSQIAASGDLYSRQGTFNYLNTEFRITEATAEFRDYRGFSPILDVKAETWANGVHVFLGLSGPTDNLQMELTSEPELSQTEIIQALGVLGRLERLVEAARGEADIAGVMQEELLRMLNAQFREQFLGGVENIFQSALALDDFRIEPNLLEQDLRIRLGKHLTDKLYLSYERTLAELPQETLRLDYHVLPRINLYTQVDEAAEVRLGLEAKFRF